MREPTSEHHPTRVTPPRGTRQQRRRGVALLLLASAACAPAPPPTPAPAPPPAAPPAGAAPLETSRTAARFDLAPVRAARFRYEGTARVSAEGDTATDSLTTRALVTLEVRPAAAGWGVRGRVDSLTVSSARRPGAAPQRAPRSTPFAATIDQGARRVLLPNDTAADCGDLAAVARQVGRALVWNLPPALAPGTSWSDTTRRVVCVGTLAATITTENRYRAERPRGGSAPQTLLVVRRSTGELTGSGVLRGATTTLMGRLTSVDTLALDPAAGALLGSNGVGETELAVTAAGRTERYRQRSRQRFTAER